MKTRFADLDEFFRETGRTHEWLAEQVGVDKSYISLIRNRQRQPSLSIAITIQKLTGVPVETLVRVAS